MYYIISYKWRTDSFLTSDITLSNDSERILKFYSWEDAKEWLLNCYDGNADDINIIKVD